MKSPPAGMPPLPVRKSRMQSDERRRQLLRVAIDSFARSGFGGTKTKDIAAAAGVSEAILFRHFATKEDLYHAILDAKETRGSPVEALRELQRFADRRDDAGVFRYLATRIVRSFEEDPAFHRLILYACLEGHLLASLFHKRFGLPTGDFLRRYIALRQTEGAFRKCDPAVAVMFALGTIVQYAMTRHLFGVKKMSQDDDAVIQELVKLVMGGLENISGDKRKEGKNGKR